MNDILPSRPDRLTEIMFRLRRGKERELIEEVARLNFRLSRIADSPTKEMLLDLSSRARRYLKETSYD